MDDWLRCLFQVIFGGLAGVVGVYLVGRIVCVAYFVTQKQFARKDHSNGL